MKFLQKRIFDKYFEITTKEGYSFYFIDKKYIVSKKYNNSIGYAIFKNQIDNYDLIEIGILPEFQNKGYGSKLLKESIKDKQKILLEVSIENENAIKLYKSLDFKILRTIPNYYKNTSAYLMEYTC